MSPLSSPAPAERAPWEVFHEQLTNLHVFDLLTSAYQSVNEAILILNPERQIVFANDNALRFLEVSDASEVYGCRPGEVMHCYRAELGEGGCGTSEFCRTCGALKALMGTQRGEISRQECHILKEELGDALDLIVKTTPLQLNDITYTVAAITDMSDERRRRALERLFFHDLLNRASGIQGIAEVMHSIEGNELEEFRLLLLRGVNSMIEDIRSQRTLRAAESNELKAHPVQLIADMMVRELQEHFSAIKQEFRQTVSYDCNCPGLIFHSDPNLLLRALWQLVKNALAASPLDHPVTLQCYRSDNQVVFAIHNVGCIAEEARPKLFQRSYSSQDPRRGMGSYSAKLIAEGFLYGKVDYTTDPEAGTTFWIALPLEWPEPLPEPVN